MLHSRQSQTTHIAEHNEAICSHGALSSCAMTDRLCVVLHSAHTTIGDLEFEESRDPMRVSSDHPHDVLHRLRPGASRSSTNDEGTSAHARRERNERSTGRAPSGVTRARARASRSGDLSRAGVVLRSGHPRSSVAHGASSSVRPDPVGASRALPPGAPDSSLEKMPEDMKYGEDDLLWSKVRLPNCPRPTDKIPPSTEEE